MRKLTKKMTIYFSVAFFSLTMSLILMSCNANKQYTIEFLNEDGTLITSINVGHEQLVEYNMQTPTKDADEQYVYEFAGWKDSQGNFYDILPNASQNETYTAVFTKKDNLKTVVFYNNDLKLYETTVAYGESVTYLGNTPLKNNNVYETYEFEGWTLASSEELIDLSTYEVKTDVEFYASFEATPILHEVSFVDDGKTLQTYNLQYGSKVTLDFEEPTKTSTEQYNYTFEGWKVNGQLVDLSTYEITEPVTFVSSYTSSLVEYKVSFISEGKILEEKELPYGTVVTYDNGTVNKDATAQYTYLFEGWKLEGELVDLTNYQITKEITLEASFQEITNAYDVTFNIDGKLITDKFFYGQTPIYEGNEPAREANPQYKYEFKGWGTKEDGEVVDISSLIVEGKVTFYAIFDSIENRYNIRLYDNETLLKEESFAYGTTLNDSYYVASKEASEGFTYTFTNWVNGVGEVVSLNDVTMTKDIDLYASYSAVKDGVNYYEVRANHFNLDGTFASKPTVTLCKDNEIYTINAKTLDNLVASHDYKKGYIDSKSQVITFYYSNIDVWDGTSVSSALVGEGSEENPYLIQSGADLAYLKDQVSSGNTYAEKHFKLTTSIDLSNTTNFRIGTSSTVSFGGNFDGNNCSIRGINMSGTGTRVALFYELLEGSTLKNISTYGKVEGAQCAGGVVGYNVGIMDNCTNYVDVTQSNANAVGGVAGFNAAFLYNSVNYGTVTCTTNNNKTGGVTGGMGEKRNNATTKGCINFGTVNAKSLVGGVVGEIYKTGLLLENCQNYGTVISSTGDVAGVVAKTAGAGGVINCQNYGNVKTTATASGVRSAGVVGALEATSFVDNCQNYGLVEGAYRVSGVVGNALAKVSNSTNYGTVKASAGWVGGVVGTAQSITVSNCENYGVVQAKYETGGVVGSVGTNRELIVENAKNYGEVRSTTNTAGGIVGNASQSTSVTIKNSENYGTIIEYYQTTLPTEYVKKVGGIVGYIKCTLVIEGSTNHVEGLDNVGCQE